MRPSILVGLALLLGAFTAYLAAQWVGLGTQASSRPHVRLVAASTAIEAGTVIASGQVKAVDWLSPEWPAQAVQEPQKVVGRVTRYPLQPGELVLESKLAPTDAKAGLAAMITEGKRAISVRVNEVIAVAGFALPGNYVDVLVSGKDNAQQPFSRVVISRAKVLAIAQDTAADPAKPKVVNAVTLELTPQETERLDLARAVGTLSLVLRNESDNIAWTSPGARLSDILGSNGGPKGQAITGTAMVTADPSANTPVGTTASLSRLPVRDRSAERGAVQEIRGMVRNEVHP
jgi:pilus assembly protein CpaB